MKIECTSCHLTGNINSVDVPAEGRHFECPKCKSSFFVTKPAPETESGNLMSMCPTCQYSTFTDEMFAVCPKCGTTGTDYQKMLLKKSAEKPARPISVQDCPEEPPATIDCNQIQHDFELLTRSLRNPDFATAPRLKQVQKNPPFPCRSGLAVGLRLQQVEFFSATAWQDCCTTMDQTGNPLSPRHFSNRSQRR